MLSVVGAGSGITMIPCHGVLLPVRVQGPERGRFVTRAAHSSAFADQDPANPILLCDLLDALSAMSEVDRARSVRVVPLPIFS